MRLSGALLFAAALAFGCGAAKADPDDPIGSAVSVVNYVTASLDNEPHRLSSGDDVRQQELIEVDEDSRSEIELNDRTKLALGPGSRLLLDRFVYDPDISGGAIVVNLVKGAFRFITGIAVKPAYVIRTPVASVTVRGTIFDVYVISPTETWLLLIEGAVEVCPKNGKCLLHNQPGKLIRITADGVDAPSRWAKFKRRDDAAFNDAFPFIVEPPTIDPDPIFTRDDIVLSDEPVKPKKVEYEEEEQPKAKTYPKHTDNDDDGAARPSKKRPSKVEVADDPEPPRRHYEPRWHPREDHYRPHLPHLPHRPHWPHRPHYEDGGHGSRAGHIFKKGLKAGIGGLGRIFGRGHRY